jgi:hypothetical protein
MCDVTIMSKHTPCVPLQTHFLSCLLEDVYTLQNGQGGLDWNEKNISFGLDVFIHLQSLLP